jgi:hypothetical protein
MRSEDLRCCRCSRCSRVAGRVVAWDVSAGFALEGASVSANFRRKDGGWGLRATSCARAARFKVVQEKWRPGVGQAVR